MSLVTTKDLMLDAQKNHYAIGAFNAENMEMVQAIIAAAPKRVVYVSCGAPTLARDAKLLAEGGYAAEKVQCVDMFCWTGAVETVMVLSKPSIAEQTGLQ